MRDSWSSRPLVSHLRALEYKEKDPMRREAWQEAKGTVRTSQPRSMLRQELGTHSGIKILQPEPFRGCQGQYNTAETVARCSALALRSAAGTYDVAPPSAVISSCLQGPDSHGHRPALGNCVTCQTQSIHSEFPANQPPGILPLPLPLCTDGTKGPVAGPYFTVCVML